MSDFIVASEQRNPDFEQGTPSEEISNYNYHVHGISASFTPLDPVSCLHRSGAGASATSSIGTASGAKVAKLEQTTLVGKSVITAAHGDGTPAKASVGTITSSQIGGGVTQTTVVGGGVAVSAKSQNAFAVASIGSIDRVQAGGSVMQTAVVAGDVTATAGQAGKVCMNIGSLGKAAC